MERPEDPQEPSDESRPDADSHARWRERLRRRDPVPAPPAGETPNAEEARARLFREIGQRREELQALVERLEQEAAAARVEGERRRRATDAEATWTAGPEGERAAKPATEPATEPATAPAAEPEPSPAAERGQDAPATEEPVAEQPAKDVGAAVEHELARIREEADRARAEIRAGAIEAAERADRARSQLNETTERADRARAELTDVTLKAERTRSDLNEASARAEGAKLRIDDATANAHAMIDRAHRTGVEAEQRLSAMLDDLLTDLNLLGERVESD